MNCQKQMDMNTSDIVEEQVPRINDVSGFADRVRGIVRKYGGGRAAGGGEGYGEMAKLFLIMIVNRE